MKIGFQVKQNRKRYLLLSINILLVLAFFVTGQIAGRRTRRMYSQQAASRWNNDGENYAQVSVFTSPERNMQTEDIDAIRNGIMTALVKESFEKKGEGARLWIDAYSGETSMEVRKDWNTLTVTAVGVGNDFFLFHPLQFLSGGGIRPDDENASRIVLDENLAWALFGSNDIVGMQVWLDSEIFTVAGVVAVEEDTLSKLAYGAKNRIYVPYEKLKQHRGELNITCYEAVLPNPITNYAYYTVCSACGLEDGSEENTQLGIEKNPLNFDSCEVLENSSRFEGLSLLSKRKSIALDAMRTNSISYPYWENSARAEEARQLHWLILRLLLLVFPVLSVIVLICRYWKHRSWTFTGIVVGRIQKIVEEKREERAERLEKEREWMEEQEGMEEQERGAAEESDRVQVDGDGLKETKQPEEDNKKNKLRSVTPDDIFHI